MPLATCAHLERNRTERTNAKRGTPSRARWCARSSCLARTAAEPRGVGRLLSELEDLFSLSSNVKFPKDLLRKNLREMPGGGRSWRQKNSRERISPGKTQRTVLKKHRPTHKRTRRRSPSSTRATLPSRLLPTARYPPQLPARSPASPRPARNAPRLAAHERCSRAPYGTHYTVWRFLRPSRRP